MPSRHESHPEPVVFVLLALCVPASLAWAHGPVVQCEPCDKRAVAQCEQPLDCEPVKEHGCGCCFTCALAPGHACGVYTERCGSGLRCSPRVDEARPLQALLEGRGECQLQRSLTEPTEKAAEDDVSDASEESESTIRWIGPSVGSGPRNPRFFVINEPHTTAESRKAVEEPPCKQRMDRLMRQMKENPILNIRRLHLPNCDRRGYFKKRQCKPSKGRKRGLCWCVNKLGMRIPDSEHVGGKRKCQNVD
uniref:insulin-like growth factor-binding protein 5 n=1 Tax=Myxine glutinosa TaxID=7769 RepID=UPI00358F8EDC